MTIGATHSFLFFCRRRSAWTDSTVLAATTAIGRNDDSGRDDSVGQGSVDRDSGIYGAAPGRLMLLQRILGGRVIRCREVADGAQVKVGPEELLNGENLAAVEAAASPFSRVPR